MAVFPSSSASLDSDSIVTPCPTGSLLLESSLGTHTVDPVEEEKSDFSGESQVGAAKYFIQCLNSGLVRPNMPKIPAAN
jgi:hypothetical protein